MILFSFYVEDELINLANLICGTDVSIDNLDITDENKSIIYLILARKAFINENYQLGDSYVVLVQETLNKSLVVQRVLKFLRLNRN